MSDQGPTSESMSVTDYVVCRTGASTVDDEEFARFRPVGNRFADSSEPSSVVIGRGIRLSRIETSLAERIMDACSPRGENFPPPSRQFGQLYSYSRGLPLDGDAFPDLNWDPDQAIAECLQLSRLIIDNANSYRYAARLIQQPDKPLIIPADRYFGGTIYRVRDTRDWMTVNEAEQLQVLAAKFWAEREELPTRVTLAMWKVEYASYQAFGEGMLGELVSGLESLLKTGRGGLTKQFRERVVSLAAEIGMSGVSAEFADRVYEARSDWHHGAPVKLFAPGDKPGEPEVTALEDVALLQDLARAAVRCAIENNEFRQRFESADTVASYWPVAK